MAMQDPGRAQDDATGRAPAPADRAATAGRLVAGLPRRPEAPGDALPIVRHPDLMPDLADELLTAQQIRQAYLAARRAGEVREPLPVLPLDELESPIVVPDEPPADETAYAPVSIDGYAVLAEIAGGGQATVYRGVQESTGRAVAIKVLPGGRFASSRNRGRFAREAAILARLDHPNVVGIIDRGRTADGSFFIVMPFVDGLPLDEHLAGVPDTAGDPRPVLALFATIARALDEAHRRGVVHRDLKPSNVRVDRRGAPHVLDFGLARLLDERPDAHATRTGQILGTLPWASPEQVAGGAEPLDARSDVYSLGVVLYVALTGSHPYRVVGSLLDVADAIRHAPPPPPSRFRARWSRRDAPHIDAVLARALAKSPEDRYGSAGDLADDLERCAARRPTDAARVSSAARSRRALVGLGMAAVIVAAAVAVLVHTRPPPKLVAALPSHTNSVGMRLVRIPAGPFRMGSAAHELGHEASERLHDVVVRRPYYIGCHEVTAGQFAAVMGGSASADDRPAVVSWEDANEFCTRLGVAEGRRYRLPTEEEWEHACRAGSNQVYGDAAGRPGDVAWHAANAGGVRQRVGAKQPNTWGIYDMQGNVREWCADAWSEGYDPTPGDEQIAVRVVKGGSVVQPVSACRPAYRMPVPMIGAADVGFRVVLEPDVSP